MEPTHEELLRIQIAAELARQMKPILDTIEKHIEHTVFQIARLMQAIVDRAIADIANPEPILTQAADLSGETALPVFPGTELGAWLRNHHTGVSPLSSGAPIVEKPQE